VEWAVIDLRAGVADLFREAQDVVQRQLDSVWMQPDFRPASCGQSVQGLNSIEHALLVELVAEPTVARAVRRISRPSRHGLVVARRLAGRGILELSRVGGARPLWRAELTPRGRAMLEGRRG
jgi:hypothetical protein